MDKNTLEASRKEAARLIREGRSDRSIAVDLGIDRRTVQRVRTNLGVAPITSRTPVEKVLRSVTPPDADGHMLWTGSFTTSGVPRIRHHGFDVVVTHVMFRERCRREPVGVVKADCGVRGCVAPTHVVDDIERRTIRLLMRTTLGHYGPWNECRKCGGDWDTFGRVSEGLHLYCMRCSSARARRSHLNRQGN